MVAEFKKCYTEDTYVASGSGSKINDFIYYEETKFLKNIDKHRQPLSTITSSQAVTNIFLNEGAENIKKLSTKMPCIPETIASSSQIKMSSLDKSSNKSSVNLKSPPSSLVPEYDEFAKKKLKLMEKDDDGLKQVNKKMIETLDSLQKKNDQSRI